MDIQVKERLTGALILVALLVLLVPEILPGPVADRARPGNDTATAGGPPLRSYSMDLNARPDGAAPDQSALAPQTAAPESEVAETAAVNDVIDASPAAGSEAQTPPPVAAVPDDQKPLAETPAAAKPAAEKPAAEKPAAPAVANATAPRPTQEQPAPAGSWWVQMGSFSQSANAQRLTQQLNAAGFRAQMSPVRSGGKELFRVRAGPVGDRAAAQALQARLAAAGHKGSLVAP